MMINLPRVKIAHLPTPIEALPRLGAALGGLRLFVKRDDQTGLAFGGNKTRKLELLVAEAQANGAQTLITAGAVQSNHCRQTAAAAARFGLDCLLVLGGEQPASPSANLLLDRLFGAEIVWTTMAERTATLKNTFQQAWDAGRRPYLVPYGGSSPVGAAAYALAMQELAGQWNQPPLQAAPDWIVFASSSGGTQAGLVVGTRLTSFAGKVLGISIDEAAGVLQKRVASLANETAERLGLDEAFSPKDILVDDHYLGGGYGVVGPGEREAVNLFARLEGLLLDPVYTGRAAAGLIDLARQGFFPTGQSVLFWHTGGSTALFADKYSDIA
jgi:D-cysteine desulfhydrase family pyridoxal phosphate-dependent enzyme